MAVFATWLADALRETGYPVVEVAGWKTRGSSGGKGFTGVEGVVLHHTAGAKSGNYPSYGVVLNGRAGLSGPLSQVGLARDGTWYVFGAGRANHAGTSRWAGYSNLNSSFIGIEAESVGDGNDWTGAQRDAYPRGVAAILKYIRRSSGRAGGHREVGLPAGRKIDPKGFDMNEIRTLVQSYLDNPATLRKGGGAVSSGGPTFTVGQRVIFMTLPQMSGKDVESVQKWAGVNPDGFYGPETEKAVKKKQAALGLLADGRVGPNTWKKILGKEEEFDVNATMRSPYPEDNGKEVRVVDVIARTAAESHANYKYNHDAWVPSPVPGETHKVTLADLARYTVANIAKALKK